MIAQSQVVYGQTVSFVDNPVWTLDSNWSMNAPVASGKTVQDAVLDHNSAIDFALSIADSVVVTNRATLETSKEIVVLPGGELHIKGKVMLTYESIKLLPGGMIHIYDGGQLVGMADVELKALSGEFIIDEGGGMDWAGDWKNNGGSGTTFTIHGSVTLAGDLENKIDIVGDGSITVHGELNNFPNASIFGCTLQGDACCLGQDPCVLGSAETPLNVKLLIFEVTVLTDKVLVVWTTASEVNNDCFIIDRSVDAKNWKQIALATGVGTSESLEGYEVWDNNPVGGLSYYRLTQKDLEGTVSHLGIEAVTFKPPRPYFNIYPNPASDKVFISLGGFDSAEISILDYTGRRIEGAAIQSEQFEIDISTFPAGLYFVELRNGKVIETRRLVVY